MRDEIRIKIIIKDFYLRNRKSKLVSSEAKKVYLLGRVLILFHSEHLMSCYT